MIEIINGLQINYHDNSTDMGVIKEIFFEDPYQIGKIPLDSVVIDVGAHIGTFSLRCALERNCTVYAYEPCAENYKFLVDNIHVNNLDTKVRAFNRAVSNKNGVREFCVDTYHYSGSSFYLKARPFHAVKVECTTLKQIFDENNIQHCDVLKMDCEGEEKHILLDMDSISALERTGKIILEHHTLLDGKEIAEYLRNKGFSVSSNNQFQAEGGILHAARNNNR